MLTKAKYALWYPSYLYRTHQQQKLSHAVTALAQRRNPQRWSPVLILGTIAWYTEAAVLHKALQSLGVPVTFDALTAEAEIAFKWSPWSEYEIAPALRAKLRVRRIINDTHFSCAKNNVARYFADVFGYPLAVDPATTEGPMVKKSIRNAAHDGEIVIGPGPTEAGYCYSILVNNEIGDDLVEDIRIPIIGTRIPFCYVKFRPKTMRFSNTNSICGLTGISGIISAEERNKVLQFARIIGLEFGEIDALRDQTTGRLYLVDVNNTASGPPNSLPAPATIIAIDLIADAIASEFLGGVGESVECPN